MLLFWCTSRKLVHTSDTQTIKIAYLVYKSETCTYERMFLHAIAVGVQVGNLYIREIHRRLRLLFWCTSRKLVHTSDTQTIKVAYLVYKSETCTYERHRRLRLLIWCTSRKLVHTRDTDD
jgi:hypothetical protein